MIAKLIEKWVNRDRVGLLKLKVRDLESSVEYWRQLCQRKILDKVQDIQDLIANDARERRSKYALEKQEQLAKDYEIVMVELKKYKQLYDDAIKPEPKDKNFQIIFKDQVMETIVGCRYEETLLGHFFYDGYGNEIAMFKDVAGIKIKEI